MPAVAAAIDAALDATPAFFFAVRLFFAMIRYAMPPCCFAMPLFMPDTPCFAATLRCRRHACCRAIATSRQLFRQRITLMPYATCHADRRRFRRLLRFSHATICHVFATPFRR